IEKPQTAFKRKPDNFSMEPFKPILTSKPHAKVPLHKSLEPRTDLAEYGDRLFYDNPYKVEIEDSPFPDQIFEKADPIPPKPWGSNPAIWIDTPEQLNDLVDELSTLKEIAVDLEHHSVRSFYGFVCLMQISSREKDWLIDTISLYDHMEVFNNVFANPQILKVFHGAQSDIHWLQQHFGLYVVSLFDTQIAAKALNLEKMGLAYLLEKYCSFVTAKKYQLADWRQRPLSPSMMAYAQSDTHFLLYIYDNLRNALIDSPSDLLNDVIRSCRSRSATQYEKPFDRAELGEGTSGWKNLVAKNRLSGQKTIAAVKALCMWRDRIARVHDESYHHVLPNHVIIRLAMSVPTTATAVLKTSSKVSTYVEDNAAEIASLLK
ncbi:hypothetical protein CANCADRAFT_11487, partial [Tortispora caseinolytica NRRL Y-17796]